MIQRDYRLRKMDKSVSKDVTRKTEITLEELFNVITLHSSEALLFDHGYAILKSPDLKEYSRIRTITPRRTKVDYVKNLEGHELQEKMYELTKEYNLAQRETAQIVKTFNKGIQTKMNQFEKSTLDKLNSLKKITHTVVEEKQITKWEKDFNKYYEGLVQCLNVEDVNKIPKELRDNIINKLDVLDTYIADFKKA